MSGPKRPVDAVELNAPPFFRATTVEELEQASGMQAVGHERVRLQLLRPGWQLALYSVAKRDTSVREPVWGWVREPFAVAEFPADDDRGVAALTHLPTGMRILNADCAETAADAAVVVAGQVDWPAFTTEGARKLDTGGLWRVLQGAGFERSQCTILGLATFVWKRRPFDA
jgi:hypothetical protein